MIATEPVVQENLYREVPRRLSEERFDTLYSREGVTIERIVSTGHATAEGTWYDQPWEEWVLVLSGAAEILFADEKAPRQLVAGDYLQIPAHRRHRVTWTSSERPTVWLAVHAGKPAAGL